MTQSESNNFWALLEVLAKRRNMIFAVVILATLGAVVTAMVLPKWYRANALLLPPKNVAPAISGSAEISEAISITSGLNLPVLTTPTDVYARMLKSRTVTSKLIDSYNLKDRYKTTNFEETFDALMYYTSIRVTEEGLLSVSVEDKDPQMAADLTNGFIDELDKVNKQIISERIAETRDFVESRLNQVKQELDSSRFALEEFQVKFKTVDFDEQTRLAVEQAVQLKIKLAELDLKYKMNQITLGKENAELVKIEQERDIIKRQLSELETINPDSSFFSLPVAEIPKLKGQYEILYSRVKVAEALYKVLLQQNEQAKMKEFEKMPTISVLDHAQVPEIKSRPKRTLIVLGTFSVSFIFALFLALLLEYFVKLKEKNIDDYNRAMFFLSRYFGWLPGVKKSEQK
ncbi:MAG: hypothetical protein DWP97_11860 [Calditrichaeota bacterium]|nr:MAG: hypothetical protein DWP97_11860 [Calditrichota bacterium]